jgi:hypothetical protein
MPDERPHIDWSRTLTPVRLRAGLALFDAGRHGHLLQGDDGGLTRVRVVGELIDAARPVLRGDVAPAAALAGSAALAEDLGDLLSYFADAGYLDEPAREPAPRVRLVGDGPLADAVAALLRQTDDGDAPTETPEALVACAGPLPDTLFRRLDDECARDGLAFHHLHVEGRRVWLGPLAVPGRGPRYADLRARRLAADYFPAARAALWRHLEADGGARPAWPAPAACAWAAAHVVHDLCAWRAGRRPFGADHVRLLDADTLRCEAHRVLPVPGGLMTAGPA